MNKEILKRILSSIILIPIALFFVIKGSYFFNFFILICFLISSYEWHHMSKNKRYYLPGFIFIIFSFYTVYFSRSEYYGDYLYFIIILMICIFTDVGGYLFGKIFKGPKLTKISPNKTYAGAIGGYFLSFISLIFIINYTDYPNQLSTELVLILILISSVSQFGDLTVSFFKRKSKIKNTGNIIPGHGGLLDRVDGMIFAFPIYYLINLTGYLKI